MTEKELGQLFAKAIMLIIKRTQLDDAERVSIAEFHEEWDSTKSYGSNEYLRFGTTETGRAQLWRTTRNVAAGVPAPGQPANPANFVRV